MWHYNDSNTLMHYGIKGMKWGVRRYQNYDGSYTQRGLARFRKSEKNMMMLRPVTHLPKTAVAHPTQSSRNVI